MQVRARTRRRGSSGRERQVRAVRSGITRTGRHPTTHDRPAARPARAFSRRVAGCGSSASRRRSSAAAAGTRTSRSRRRALSSVTSTARRGRPALRIWPPMRPGPRSGCRRASGSPRAGSCSRYRRPIRSASWRGRSSGVFRRSSTSTSTTPTCSTDADGSCWGWSWLLSRAARSRATSTRTPPRHLQMCRKSRGTT